MRDIMKKHVYREAKVMTALGVDYIQICENCGVPEGIDKDCKDVATERLYNADYIEKALKAVAST